MKLPSKETRNFITFPFGKGKSKKDVVSEDEIKSLASMYFFLFGVGVTCFSLAEHPYVKDAGLLYGGIASAVRGLSVGYCASTGFIGGSFLSAYLVKPLNQKLESTQKPLAQKVNKHVTHRRVVALGAGLGLLCASYWGDNFAKPIGDDIVQWGKEARAKPPITAPAPTIPSRPTPRSPSHNSPAPSHP